MFFYSIAITVKEDKIGEFIEFCHSVANEFKKEEGYRALNVYRNRENTNSYLLLIEWESKSYMEKHLRGDKFSLLKGGAIVLGQQFKIKIDESPTRDHSQWEKMNLPR